jgi:hypothetical protein
VEFIVTKIKELVDWFEWFKIDENLLFGLTVISENGTTKDDKTIVWGFVVKLQS